MQSQEAFLVRQTLSSNGTSANLTKGYDQLLIQQSVGQLSVTGKSESNQTLLRQGFIQAPLGGSLNIKLAELQISSYPNPFNDQIIIDWSEEMLNEVTIILRDCTGKVVVETSCSGMIQTWSSIETHHLTVGSYILQVTSDNRLFTSKLIKI